jgi:hypothetical protein
VSVTSIAPRYGFELFGRGRYFPCGTAILHGKPVIQILTEDALVAGFIGELMRMIVIMYHYTTRYRYVCAGLTVTASLPGVENGDLQAFLTIRAFMHSVGLCTRDSYAANSPFRLSFFAIMPCTISKLPCGVI